MTLRRPVIPILVSLLTKSAEDYVVAGGTEFQLVFAGGTTYEVLRDGVIIASQVADTDAKTTVLNIANEINTTVGTKVQVKVLNPSGAGDKFAITFGPDITAPAAYTTNISAGSGSFVLLASAVILDGPLAGKSPYYWFQAKQSDKSISVLWNPSAGEPDSTLFYGLNGAPVQTDGWEVSNGTREYVDPTEKGDLVVYTTLAKNIILKMV